MWIALALTALRGAIEIAVTMVKARRHRKEVQREKQRRLGLVNGTGVTEEAHNIG